jgi:hypothetical protein
LCCKRDVLYGEFLCVGGLHLLLVGNLYLDRGVVEGCTFVSSAVGAK